MTCDWYAIVRVFSSQLPLHHFQTYVDDVTTTQSSPQGPPTLHCRAAASRHPLHEPLGGGRGRGGKGGGAGGGAQRRSRREESFLQDQVGVAGPGGQCGACKNKNIHVGGCQYYITIITTLLTLYKLRMLSWITAIVESYIWSRVSPIIYLLCMCTHSSIILYYCTVCSMCRKNLSSFLAQGNCYI